MHADIRIHLCASIIHLRYFLAGNCHTSILEILLLHISINFLYGFVRINNMGATLSEIPFEYKALWIQTGFYFLTTCWVYRWQIIKSRKHVIDKYKEMKNKGKGFFS